MTGMGVRLLLSGDVVRASPQVWSYNAGAAPRLHLSKFTDNVWFRLTKGGDCSRWYLRKKDRREINKSREGEREMSLFFSSLPRFWLFSVHDSWEHVSACVGVLDGWSRTPPNYGDSLPTAVIEKTEYFYPSKALVQAEIIGGHFWSRVVMICIE